MIIEHYIKNWGFEFIYEKFENLWKSILLILGNKKWKSKKTYAVYNQKFYKNSKICKQIGWIKYLPFNIRYIMVDINYKNIPFMLNVYL